MANQNLSSVQALLDAGLPELGPGPRPNTRPLAALNAALDTSLAGAALPSANRELIRAIVLLWHDHLDAAHVIAQDLDTADGSLVHGIMHRREPDYSNAKYWFRRAGEHRCFPELARRVSRLPGWPDEAGALRKLLRAERWDAFAFVDLCEAAAQSALSAGEREALRQVQKIETETLLDYLSNAG